MPGVSNWRRRCIAPAGASCSFGKSRSLPRCEPTKYERCYDRTQQYSITALTDGAGQVVERYAYTAYGEPTILDASLNVLPDSAVDNRYLYTGREWDGELGLYHYRARMYSAESGRFVSRDPIGYWDGASLYRAHFAPNGLDPSGLDVYGQTTVDHYIRINGNRRLRIKIVINIEDTGSQICVNVHARRMIEENPNYRDRWNDVATNFIYPGRGIWDPDNLWFYPNLSLLLNGGDDENEYGGPYFTGGGTVDHPITGEPVPVPTTYYPDDDYLQVDVTGTYPGGTSGQSSTNIWHVIGQMPDGTDPKTSIQHVAGSERICVDKNPCGLEGDVNISLNYPDPRWGGNQGSIDIPYGPSGGSFGQSTGAQR